MTAAFAEPTYADPPRRTHVALVVPAPTSAEDERNLRLAAAAQRRAAARTRDLAALLRERPDLAGVHAPADFAVDATLWCA